MKNQQVKLRGPTSVFISVLVFMVTIEFWARIDDKVKYNAHFFGHYSAELLRCTDSEGITHNVPNSQFEKWKINQAGFRGPDVTLTKPKGVIRIVCMGTSETFGLYENPDMEWTSQLMDILKEFHCFQVVNASTVGLPFKKYIRYIEKYVMKVEPDAVILYVNPFSYGVGEEKFTNRQLVSREDVRNSKKGYSIFLGEDIYNLRMIAKIKQVVNKALPVEVLKWYRLFKIIKELRVFEYNRLNGKEPLDVVSQESVDIFKADLQEVIEFLRHRKIEVILSSYPVLISPDNILDHLDIFIGHRSYYVELSLLGIIDASLKFNDVIKALANKQGIAFIDINAAIPKNTRYFADNVHYTNEGAKLVATNFADYIKNRWVN